MEYFTADRIDNPRFTDQPFEDDLFRGEDKFPVFIQYTDLAVTETRAHLWHWHNELQLCVVTSGDLTFQLENNDYHLRPGQGIFINTKRIHRTVSIPDMSGTFICIGFRPEFLKLNYSSTLNNCLDQFSEREDIEALVFDPSVAWQKSIIESIERIYNIKNASEMNCEMKIIAVLFGLSAVLLSHFSELPLYDSRSVSMNFYIRSILSYIEDNYQSKITLEDVAEAVHLSEGACCRMFKASLKCTIFEYILELRLRKAAGLLSGSDLSVNEIAYQSGFSGVSYFIKQFHEKYGCTPKQYRVRY